MFKENPQDRYSLRKTAAYGLASCVIGLMLFSVNTQKANADVAQPAKAKTVQVEQKSTNTAPNAKQVPVKTELAANNTAKLAKKSGNTNPALIADSKAQNLAAKPTQQPALSAKPAQNNTAKPVTIQYDSKNPDKNQTLIAGQDQINIDVHVNFDDKNTDAIKSSPVTIKVGNDTQNGQFKDINISPAPDNSSMWNYQRTNDGYQAKYIGEGVPKNLELDFGLQGSFDIKAPETIKPVVTVTMPDNTSVIAHLGGYKYKPYVAVPRDEGIGQYGLLKGFRIGDTTIGNESYWGNIHAEPNDENNNDLDTIKNDKYNGDPNAYALNGKVISASKSKLYQYGFYFNYNKLLAQDLRDYISALFHIKFGGDQEILPSTIKVFAVPNDMIGTKGKRIKIGDPNPRPNTKGSVYDYITSYAAGLERPNLEKVLKDLANKAANTMSFTKDKASNAFDSNTAYFIQVDTIPTGAEGPTFITYQYKGKGIVPIQSSYYPTNMAPATSSSTDSKPQLTKPEKPQTPPTTPGGQTTKSNNGQSSTPKPDTGKTDEPPVPEKPGKPGQPTGNNPTTPSEPTQPTQSTQPTQIVPPHTTNVPSVQVSVPQTSVPQSSMPVPPHSRTNVPSSGKTIAKTGKKSDIKTDVPPLNERRKQTSKTAITSVKHTQAIKRTTKHTGKRTNKRVPNASPVYNYKWTKASAKKTKSAKALPQTSEKPEGFLALLGMMLSALAACLGLKKKHN